MLENNKIFPDDLAPNHIKNGYAWGKEVAEAITSQWWGGNLYQRRNWINKMRQYSRGEQSTDPYKKIIEGSSKRSQGGDGSNPHFKTHKIDYLPLKIMPNFKNILVNAIDESLFKPKAEAIDITAVDKKRNFFKKLEDNFYTKDFASIIQSGTGVNMRIDDLPETEDELKIKKLEYKPLIEIANEVAIESVIQAEKFEAVKDKIDKDLFDLGVGVMRHFTDPTEGIKLKYVDPNGWIHNDFQDEDGKDIRYHGVILKATISEIEKQAKRPLTQDELDSLKKLSLNTTETIDPYSADMDGNRLVEYIHFSYLTRKQSIYKKAYKNGSFKAIDKTNDDKEYNPPKASKRFDIPYKVWYEGIYIPTADILVSWDEMENQVVDNVGEPVSPFIIYAPNVKNLSEEGYVRFDSLVERAIPIIDDIHKDFYKFQQLKMELRPQSIEIDVDAINEVSLNGVPVSPKDILDLFFGRGVLLKKRYSEDGDEIGKAVTETGNDGVTNAMVFLSKEFTASYDKLRQLIGINELRDGTTVPNSKTAVAVQKILLASSNNATNHIVKGSFAMSLKMCECVSYRLKDILDDEDLKEQFISKIGTDNIEILDEIKNITAHTFAIYFDFKPDNEERLAFEQSLIDSKASNEINVAQYNKSRQIRNTKSAIKYLEFVVEQNVKKAQELKNQSIRVQAEAQAQTTVVSERAKQETLSVTWSVKEKEMLLKDKLETDMLLKKAKIQELGKKLDHGRNLEVKSIEGQNITAKEEFKEDRKDERVDKQDTNESKKIYQRQNQTEPINFENELDDIFKDNEILANQDN